MQLAIDRDDREKRQLAIGVGAHRSLQSCNAPGDRRARNIGPLALDLGGAFIEIEHRCAKLGYFIGCGDRQLLELVSGLRQVAVAGGQLAAQIGFALSGSEKCLGSASELELCKRAASPERFRGLHVFLGECGELCLNFALLTQVLDFFGDGRDLRDQALPVEFSVLLS